MENPFRRVFARSAGLFESARAHEGENKLSLVDIESGSLYILGGGTVQKREVAKQLSFADEFRPNSFVFAARQSIGVLIGSDQAKISGPLISSERRFNDGAVDSAGRLVLGTMNLGESDGKNSLYILSNSGDLEEIDGDLGLCNGVSADYGTGDLIYVDTIQGRLYRRQFLRRSRSYGEREVFHQFVEYERPDGLTRSSDGFFFVALWGSSQVAVLNSSGIEMSRLPVPPRFPTSVAISGRRGVLSVAGASTPRENIATVSPAGIWECQTHHRPANRFAWDPSPFLLERLLR